MAEIIKVALTNHSEILSQLEVDSVVILCHPLRSPELTHENIRCLDWTLNHQVRKARKNMGEMSVFIPSMKKINIVSFRIGTTGSRKKLRDDGLEIDRHYF